MIGLLCFVMAVLASPFKSKIRLEAENAVLRHQLTVLRRRLRGRVRLNRWFFIQLYRWFPSILKVLAVIRPETLVRWHRAGFRSYWRWKSRSLGGRPQIETDLRALIRQMSIENSLWYHTLRLIAVMIAAVTVLMIAHLAEVLVWSLIYVATSAAPEGADLIYFAFVNYTTLGYGDVTPVERWHLLGPMTAMNGVLLFGWSTAVIFEVLRMTLLAGGDEVERQEKRWWPQ